VLGLARELDASRRVVAVAEAKAGLLVAAGCLAGRGEDVIARKCQWRCLSDWTKRISPSTGYVAVVPSERRTRCSTDIAGVLSADRLPTSSIGPRPPFSTAERNASLQVSPAR
jgi:hypothetical protein